MRIQQHLRGPALAVVAVVGAASAACSNSSTRSDISTETNLSDDAAADDVLGVNEAAANDSTAP